MGRRVQGWNAALDAPRIIAIEPAREAVAAGLEHEPVEVSWIRPNGGRAPRLTGNEAVVVDASEVNDACDLAQRIHSTRPRTVVIAITEAADATEVARLNEAGISDYLDVTSLGQGDLARIARWAVERQRVVDDSAPIGFADPVSGLRNWRGFLAEGRREAGIAARYRLDVVVVVFGLFGWSDLVEEHGAEAGKAAVRDFASALGMAVRSTDLPARTNRDEFAVLLLEAGEQGSTIVSRRVKREMEGIAEREWRPWRLEWSHGWARRNADEGLESLVERARVGMERGRAARLG